MLEFERTKDAFNYVFEQTLAAGDTVIIKMPPASPTKRAVCDIGWQTDGDGVTLYGTLSSDPESVDALWQEILGGDAVNKTVYAIKAVNNGSAPAKLCLRAILY